ncbi:MAG TPA: hypothetical protein VNX25_01570, partial [Verrucomicrobiae bacterium]|nr:hypothetical protein [Verrucomicrobiae bacterium]
MAALHGNPPLRSAAGRSLSSLREINRLAPGEKEGIYLSLVPPQLAELLGVDILSGDRASVVAPEGLGLARVTIRRAAGDRDPAFFLEIADTPYHQIELSFCVINDPDAPRFDVDVDTSGRDNWFASMGRNVPEEVRAMQEGLFPNQVRRGMRMFSRFFPRFERFVDSLGIEMITAEPLTYDNAIRYEAYGFDYLSGRMLMNSISEGFRPGGDLTRRLDGSTPFRKPGMERTVRGRSWAIHDGVLDGAWDGVRIYKMVGREAGVNTFPDRAED